MSEFNFTEDGTDPGPRISYGAPGETLSPDELEEVSLSDRLNTVMPSPEDQQRGRRLRYGMNNVREQMDRGQIPPDLGMAMMGRMQAQLQPMMVRAREVPILMARLNYIRMQRQMAQQEAIFAQNMAFRSRTIDSRMHEFGEGENAFTFIETPDGRGMVVNGHSRRSAAGSTAPTFDERQRAAFERETRDFGRRQYNDWRTEFTRREGRPPNETETAQFMSGLEVTMSEFNRRFGPPPSQLSASGGAASAIGGAGPAAEAARPGTAPRPFGGVPTEPRTGSPPLPIPPDIDEVLTWRLGTARTAGIDRARIAAQVPRVRDTLTRLQNIRASRPLSPEEVAEFEAAINEVREMARLRERRNSYDTRELASMGRQ